MFVSDAPARAVAPELSRPCRGSLPSPEPGHSHGGSFRNPEHRPPSRVVDSAGTIEADGTGHLLGQFLGRTMLDRSSCAAALLLLLGVQPCAAQNKQLPPSTAPESGVPLAHDPQACSDDQRLRTGREAAQPRGAGNQTLSEKLEQTDGVLCPPDVDPDIKAPTPQAGPMPVIPPPGSPGGDPSVRPK